MPSVEGGSQAPADSKPALRVLCRDHFRGLPMRHSFGPYTLDEDARELALRDAPVAMQPRVFDLLVYLVRKAGRVVPKDELMDALWTDVTVTEASLQRLVSLARRALEAGGLGDAIRSFVRHGYRFSIDRPELSA